jgi:hypothetical protein
MDKRPDMKDDELEQQAQRMKNKLKVDEMIKERDTILEEAGFLRGMEKLATVFGKPEKERLKVFYNELREGAFTNGQYWCTVFEIIRTRPQFPQICHFFMARGDRRARASKSGHSFYSDQNGLD